MEMRHFFFLVDTHIFSHPESLAFLHLFHLLFLLAIPLTFILHVLIDFWEKERDFRVSDISLSDCKRQYFSVCKFGQVLVLPPRRQGLPKLKIQFVQLLLQNYLGIGRQLSILSLR